MKHAQGSVPKQGDNLCISVLCRILQVMSYMICVFLVGLSFSTVWFLSCIKVHMYVSTK